MDDRGRRLVSDAPICHKLPPERTGQSKFGVRFDRSHDPSKHIRRDDVHLVEKDKTPLAGRQEVHHLLCFMRSIRRVGYHGVCRDDDTTFPGELRNAGGLGGQLGVTRTGADGGRGSSARITIAPFPSDQQ